MEELRWARRNCRGGRSRFDWNWATPEIDWAVLKSATTGITKCVRGADGIAPGRGPKHRFGGMKRMHNEELWSWVLQDDRQQGIWLDGPLFKRRPHSPCERGLPDSKPPCTRLSKRCLTEMSTLAYNPPLMFMSTFGVLLLANPFCHRNGRGSIVH